MLEKWPGHFLKVPFFPMLPQGRDRRKGKKRSSFWGQFCKTEMKNGATSYSFCPPPSLRPFLSAPVTEQVTFLIFISRTHFTVSIHQGWCGLRDRACLGSDRFAEEAGHALFSGTLNITHQKDKEKVIKLCISICCKRCSISKASAMKRAMLKEPWAHVCLGTHFNFSYRFLGNVGHSWNRLVSLPQASVKHLYLRPHTNSQL